jgi:3-methyladenine DNA glycosylase/8-oxoguanine DNA glycosylase
MSKVALAHLRLVDADLGAIIDRVGPYRLKARKDGTHFDYVVRCIVGQQLSGKAAQTIYSRVLALYGNTYPSPLQLLKTPVPTLRAAGLSGRKVEYILELADRTHRNTIAIQRIHEMPDDDVFETLMAVRGIGRWTAQMVMMFRLGRRDVLPELDLGIQKGVQKMLRLRKLPTPARLQKIGAKWSPYRTYAAWYLWRSLEIPEEA